MVNGIGYYFIVDNIYMLNPIIVIGDDGHLQILINGSKSACFGYELFVYQVIEFYGVGIGRVTLMFDENVFTTIRMDGQRNEQRVDGLCCYDGIGVEQNAEFHGFSLLGNTIVEYRVE
jgi:hypothetical protein